MAEYADIQIRILAPSKESDAGMECPVEATWNGSGPWRGTSLFDFSKLDFGNMDPAEYGAALGAALFNPQVENALHQAGIPAGKYAGIRLLLDREETVPHTVRWERMQVAIGNTSWPLAISRTTAFSRYAAIQMPDAEPADHPIFRVLLAVANPSGLNDSSTIDVEKELSALVEEFETMQYPPRLQTVLLAGRTPISEALLTRMRKLGWTIESGVTSLEHVAAILDRRDCHGLHVLCHGEFRAARGTGLLYLEGEDGSVSVAEDWALRAWAKPSLKLAIFQSCRTAASAPMGDPPFTGVAYRMLGLGVPAVIAMQDYVSMKDARAFVTGFYRSLLQEGRVDAAANAGRAAVDARGGDWSIPALFMRLRGGQLLLPDPVRVEVLETRRRMARDHELPEVMPLRVTDHVRGMSYEPGLPTEGPVLDLGSALLPLLEKYPVVGLTGAPGSNKTEHSQLLYCILADRFLADPLSHAPVWLRISTLAKWGMGGMDPRGNRSAPQRLEAVFENIARGGRAPDHLAARCFRFVVQVDEELSQAQYDLALRTLNRIRDEVKDCHCLLAFDDTQLPYLRGYFPEARLLVVRPMEAPTVQRYLKGTGKESDESLARNIESRSLSDLASVPWLLSEMRLLKRAGYPFQSRAHVMKLVIDRFFGAFPGQTIPRSCADEALTQAAWQLQWNRQRILDTPELWEILDSARAGREFRLSELRDGLIRTRLLAPTQEEAVRFSYPAIQSYFAAQYLLHSERIEAELEDVTASLGRYSRLQHWEDTLVMLAGMIDSDQDRERLLRIILAGSSLLEGSQVFLAARLYAEMRLSLGAQRAGGWGLEQHRVVQQIVATLSWRSRPDLPRAYQDRRRAVEALAAMRHKDTIPFLTRVAFDKFPALRSQRASENKGDGAKARMEYDRSGTRMVAAAGLLQQAAETEACFEKLRPELLPILKAWKEYLTGGREEGLIQILKQNDPSLSPVAAFAYAYRGQRIPPDHPLLEVFRNEQTDGEVKWGITDLFGSMESSWLTETVIEPWLARKPGPSSRLCYLIQKSCWAPVDSPQYAYLKRSMRDASTVHRALRAFAKIPDPRVAEWLRNLCHQILQHKWEAAMASGDLPLRKAPSPTGVWRLEHSAIEALRDVGDLQSIDVLQDTRLQADSVLALLSFQVAEEIYWRVTGGLAIERF